MAFVQGHPRFGGRKKGGPSIDKLELRELAKAHAAEAIGTLVNLMRKAKYDQTKANAAIALLDRGFGKPTEYHENYNIDVHDLSALSDEQLGQVEQIIESAQPK